MMMVGLFAATQAAPQAAPIPAALATQRLAARIRARLRQWRGSLAQLFLGIQQVGAHPAPAHAEVSLADMRIVLEQLRVKIVATAASPTKVRLRFKSVRARVTKLFGLPLFGKRVTLVLPVPGPTLTRFLFFFSRKERPEAFFNVLYLDDDLRIHETGEGNFFVQERPVWGKSV
mgnify:CR=1 FL=1